MINRRQFLGLGAIGLTSLIGCGSDSKPVAKPVLDYKPDTGFTVAPLSMTVDRCGETGQKVIQTIEEILSKENIDIVVTPEYSFFDCEKPLVLTTPHGMFEIDYKKTDRDTVDLVKKAMLIAKEKQTHLFLGTFCEQKDEKPRGEFNSYNTLLHIDNEGTLAGVKRKGEFYGPMDVYKNGRRLRVLPLICAEASHLPNVRAITNSGIKFDLLIHSQNVGDFNFSEMARYIQEGRFTEETLKRFGNDPKKALAFFQDGFNYFYAPYLEKSMNPGSKIVICDGSTNKFGAVINADQKPIENYQVHPLYTSARI